MSRYAAEDKTKSEIDKARAQTYEAAIKPLRAFQSEVMGWANDTVKKPKELRKGGCALKWLAAWARADALSQLTTGQSQFNRDQALSTFALAYLQVASIEVPDGLVHRDIVAWLSALARDSMRYYETEAGEMSRANNHRLFAALGVGAAGIITQDPELFEWSMATLKGVACAADTSGALPLEMRRGSRARDYQIFATGPLVVLAEIAESNDVAAYEFCSGSIHRVVDYGLRSLEDPSDVAERAGARQLPLPDVSKMGSRLAWLKPYTSRFPETPWKKMLTEPMRPSSTALGGNLAIVFAGRNADVD